MKPSLAIEFSPRSDCLSPYFQVRGVEREYPNRRSFDSCLAQNASNAQDDTEIFDSNFRDELDTQLLDQLYAPEIMQVYYAFDLVIGIDNHEGGDLPLLENCQRLCC